MSPGKGRQCVQLDSYHDLLTATTSKDLKLLLHLNTCCPETSCMVVPGFKKNACTRPQHVQHGCDKTTTTTTDREFLSQLACMLVTPAQSLNPKCSARLRPSA